MIQGPFHRLIEAKTDRADRPRAEITPLLPNKVSFFVFFKEKSNRLKKKRNKVKCQKKQK